MIHGLQAWKVPTSPAPFLWSMSSKAPTSSKYAFSFLESGEPPGVFFYKSVCKLNKQTTTSVNMPVPILDSSLCCMVWVVVLVLCRVLVGAEDLHQEQQRYSRPLSSFTKTLLGAKNL